MYLVFIQFPQKSSLELPAVPLVKRDPLRGGLLSGHICHAQQEWLGLALGFWHSWDKLWGVCQLGLVEPKVIESQGSC